MRLSFLWCWDVKQLCFQPLSGTGAAKELVEEIPVPSELWGGARNSGNISLISHIFQVR